MIAQAAAWTIVGPVIAIGYTCEKVALVAGAVVSIVEYAVMFSIAATVAGTWMVLSWAFDTALNDKH